MLYEFFDTPSNSRRYGEEVAAEVLKDYAVFNQRNYCALFLFRAKSSPSLALQEHMEHRSLRRRVSLL